MGLKTNKENWEGSDIELVVVELVSVWEPRGGKVFFL